ncbi:MAG: GlxA family transcriptional regulator [Pseudomonadota bacterium]
MPPPPAPPYTIAMVVAPGFNLAASMGVLDPFRAANYLAGTALFRWEILACEGGGEDGGGGASVRASNAVEISARPLAGLLASRATDWSPDLGIVSTSWAPEAAYGAPLDAALRRWERHGAMLAGIDTGAFVLAAAGLLRGRRATVHYEHIDAFAELYPDTTITEDLYVLDGDRLSCCGGAAATDLALQILSRLHGPALTNAAARYLFHERLRAPGTHQIPVTAEPLGPAAPSRLRAAIRAMEERLEDPAGIPEIAAAAGLSQRQLERLFRAHVGRSPLRYYSDIRLDRARGLVTQTEMPLREVALASGFSSPESFARAYRARFGLPPRSDRIEGRVPFEFRAWPMHAPLGARPA